MDTMTEDERAIRRLVDTWMSASQSGDTETVLGLMTDDVVFMTAGAEPFGKEAFAAASKGMRDMRVTATGEIMEIRVVGDWAYLRSHLDVTTVRPGSAPVRRSGNTLTILRKDDGKWRIARDANLLTVTE